MVVVVGDKALESGWRHVGVELSPEVQLDLDRVGQRCDRAHKPLNTAQHDGVAVAKIFAEPGKIETAIGKPVSVRIFFVVLPDQANQRPIRPKQPHQLINGGRTVKQAVKEFRAVSTQVIVSRPPYFVDEGLDRQRSPATRPTTTRTSTPESLPPPDRCLACYRQILFIIVGQPNKESAHNQGPGQIRLLWRTQRREIAEAETARYYRRRTASRLRGRRRHLSTSLRTAGQYRHQQPSPGNRAVGTSPPLYARRLPWRLRSVRPVGIGRAETKISASNPRPPAIAPGSSTVPTASRIKSRTVAPRSESSRCRAGRRAFRRSSRKLCEYSAPMASISTVGA